ncbi:MULTISPECIES: type II toxin-antitoxin system ParD family antitoxin [unclassified Sphingopyxis]|uniref:type II toxin-antitoxin system ParD family antitoxin n=1 Tax=unclassified Sphingopyxis TaxID=2614943 RepID=UPI000AFCE1BE|nr:MULTISPECIES: type II toxin-antitoxin system ParD family antitoxin [unclassified Sphingopyxis]
MKSGRTAWVGEVVRAGLRARDREEALLDERRKARVAEALADPRPVQPAETVRRGLAARHAKRTSQGA